MPRIVIANLSEKVIEAEDLAQTLLQHLHHHGQDWMHACGAKGRCTTCKFIVLEGMHNLSGKTRTEQKYEDQGFLQARERLACQVIIFGDVRIAVPDEYKLPHLSYTF